ncbi:TonB-dependent siderophore receptor [Alteromonas sp. C1M14]|nr:TonB-dependent siderophore receptor [Alteromonas sp. C1M14]
MLRCPGHLSIAAIMGLQSPLVFAQTQQSEAEEVERVTIVTQRQAYRGDVPLKSLPQSVDVIDDAFLDALGVTDFQAALSLASGVATQNNFGGLWDSFAIRGFAGDENTPSGYLVNGFNVGRGFSGTRDTSNVAAIEVLKGPGSALYGRGEPGGTVNIVTKKPQFSEQGYIEGTIGSYSLYRLEGDYTNALSADLAFRVNGAYEDADSFRDTVSRKALNLTPSLLYRMSADTTLLYEAEFVDQQAPFDRGIVVPDYTFGTVPIETFYGEPADGPMEIDALGHQLTLQHKINDQWHLSGGMSYRDSSFEGYSTEVELSAGRQLLYTDGETVSRQRRYRDYDTLDVSGRIELSGSVTAGGVEHHMLLGADAYRYRYDSVMNRWRTAWGEGDTTYSVSLNDPIYGQTQPDVAPLVDQKEVQQAFGIYVQDHIALSETWKVLLGVRFDDYQKDIDNWLSASQSKQTQSVVSPRVGLVYAVNDAMTLYGSYSEGFRPNSGADAAGESFEPEESQSYEAGVKFALFDEQLNGTLAVYHAEKTNILTADPVNSGFSAALGEAQSEGVELDVNALVGSSTTLTLAYAYTDAATTNTITNADWGVEIPAGSQLVNIPKHSASITAQQDFMVAQKALLVSASLRYVGERLGDTVDPDYQLPSYTRLDLAASFALRDNLTVRLVLDNALDKEYYDNSYSALWTQPGTPRTAKLSVRYQY